jgi:hypothetical protein
VPTGPETKNDYADEDQQKITALLRVVTERPAPPFVEEEAPFQKHVNVLEKKYYHGCRRDPKQRMTVLTKASRKLLLCSE